MPVDPLFWLATAAFAWGLSLASYRWFAVHNGWPMGEWQAHRPGLPIAIGLFAMLFAMLFALARGGSTVSIMPLFGLVCALGWTALTRVGAQSALLLAPAAVIALLVIWMAAAASQTLAESEAEAAVMQVLERHPAAMDREAVNGAQERVIRHSVPQVLRPLQR